MSRLVLCKHSTLAGVNPKTQGLTAKLDSGEYLQRRSIPRRFSHSRKSLCCVPFESELIGAEDMDVGFGV